MVAGGRNGIDGREGSIHGVGVGVGWLDPAGDPTCRHTTTYARARMVAWWWVRWLLLSSLSLSAAHDFFLFFFCPTTNGVSELGNASHNLKASVTHMRVQIGTPCMCVHG